MKKLLCVLACVSMLLALSACGKSKILHCDNCNKEVSVSQDSNMEEDWVIYCAECNEKLFGDDPIVGNG